MGLNFSDIRDDEESLLSSQERKKLLTSALQEIGRITIADPSTSWALSNPIYDLKKMGEEQLLVMAERISGNMHRQWIKEIVDTMEEQLSNDDLDNLESNILHDLPRVGEDIRLRAETARFLHEVYEVLARFYELSSGSQYRALKYFFKANSQDGRIRVLTRIGSTFEDQQIKERLLKVSTEEEWNTLDNEYSLSKKLREVTTKIEGDRMSIYKTVLREFLVETNGDPFISIDRAQLVGQLLSELEMKSK